MPCREGMPWGGADFCGRVLRGLGDGEGEDKEESSPPGGTQIITFLGGRGGECFPPGIQGNFIGWQESRELLKNLKKDKKKIHWTYYMNVMHGIAIAVYGADR